MNKDFNHALSLAINDKLKSLGARRVAGGTSNINAIGIQVDVLAGLLDMVLPDQQTPSNSMGLDFEKWSIKHPGVEIKITEQGKPVIDEGWVVQAGKNVVAIQIEMISKYCETVGHLCGEIPGIIIQPSTRSTNLKEDAEEFTETIFPEFAGYDVFAANIFRYTLNVCLVKKET